MLRKAPKVSEPSGFLHHPWLLFLSFLCLRTPSRSLTLLSLILHSKSSPITIELTLPRSWEFF